MPHSLPLLLVLLAGSFLILLGSLALLAPGRVRRFLLQFASTARIHFWEMGLRALAGLAFVLQAPRMRHAALFAIFGWLLLSTTLGLLLIPWRWHQGFAQRVLPPVTHTLWPLGLVSLGLGGAILHAALTG